MQWDELPDSLREAIGERTGPIISVRTVSDGQNSSLAAVVETRDGRVFVKGLKSDHRTVVTQAREAAVAPLLKGIAPELLWSFDDDAGVGWHVNAFEYIEGRAADYSPRSPDIDLVLGHLEALSAIEIPGGPPFKPMPRRFKTYVRNYPSDAEVFGGSTLAHTDWIPTNILVSDGQAWLIDWAWATPGADWIDPAFWLLRLMAGGHTANEAESIVATLPAYANADPAHVDLFARANVRLWDEIVQAHPATEWSRKLADASREWACHRAA